MLLEEINGQLSLMLGSTHKDVIHLSNERKKGKPYKGLPFFYFFPLQIKPMYSILYIESIVYYTFSDSK